MDTQKIRCSLIPDTKLWYVIFYYYHWVEISTDGLLVAEGIIHPVVSSSSLTLLDISIIEIYSS